MYLGLVRRNGGKMEETPRNHEENLGGNGAGILSEMPSFEEHMEINQRIKYGSEIAKERDSAEEDLSFVVHGEGEKSNYDFPGAKSIEDGMLVVQTVFDGIPSVSRTESDFLVARHLARNLNAEIADIHNDKNKIEGMLGLLWFAYNSPLQDHDMTANLRGTADDEKINSDAKELVERIENGREAYEMWKKNN